MSESISKVVTHLKTIGAFSDALEIEKSHKFAFDPLPIPLDIMGGAKQYIRQLMAAEIFPLPFDLCTFEFGPKIFGKSGDDIFDCRFIVLVWRALDNVDSSKWAIFFKLFCETEETALSPGLVGQIFTRDFEPTGEKQNFEIVSIDNTERDYIKRNGGVITAKLQGWYEYMNVAFSYLLIVLGLISTNGGVLIEDVPSRKYLNGKRAKKGKPPLDYEYKTVRIDPSLVRLPGVVSPGGSHASPKMHWRRGHIRFLPNGKKTAVKPCIVGDPSKGTIIHDYLVKLAPEKPLQSKVDSRFGER